MQYQDPGIEFAYCIRLPGSANEQFGLILGAHSSMEGLVIVNLEASTTVEKWTLVKIADSILLCYIVCVMIMII